MDCVTQQSIILTGRLGQGVEISLRGEELVAWNSAASRWRGMPKKPAIYRFLISAGHDRVHGRCILMLKQNISWFRQSSSSNSNSSSSKNRHTF